MVSRDMVWMMLITHKWYLAFLDGRRRCLFTQVSPLPSHECTLSCGGILQLQLWTTEAEKGFPRTCRLKAGIARRGPQGSTRAWAVASDCQCSWHRSEFMGGVGDTNENWATTSQE